MRDCCVAMMDSTVGVTSVVIPSVCYQIVSDNALNAIFASRKRLSRVSISSSNRDNMTMMASLSSAIGLVSP